MGAQSVAFKEWAVNEGVTVTESIEALKGTHVGIDADDYIHSILAVGQPEPLLPALGGLPFGLYKRLNDDVEHFRRAEIEPIFIFNGLDHPCRDRRSIFREARRAEKALNQAWSVYDKGEADQAVNAFGSAILYKTEHIVRNVQLYLHRQGVYTGSALYSAASQLVHMEREGAFIEAISGSASCLVFGAEKVIISFDWAEGKAGQSPIFTWTSMTNCLEKMSLSRERFVNVCLLAGCSILPILPEIDTDSPSSRIPAVRNYMNRMGVDTNTLLHNMKDENYRDSFLKARCVLRHPVALTEDGKIEPENWQTGPADIHAFIGQRLPDELYDYLAMGALSPRVLNYRTRMEVVETPPLDGGDSEAYKRLVQDKLRPLRAQALALITRQLHRYYHKTDVDMVCYWSETSKTPLNIADQTDSTKANESWHVKTASLASKPQFDVAKSPLMFAVMALASDAEAKKTSAPMAKNGSSQLQETEDVVANAVWRLLQNRGYIASDHTLSAWGTALKAALEQANTSGLLADGITTFEIEEAIFLAFELLRHDILNSRDFFPAPPYSGAPIRGTETDRAHTLLISRVACLASFHHAEIGYTGPLSRHLLAYHQMVAALRGSLRDLVEMHTSDMYLSNTVERTWKKKAYKDVASSLPFLNEPDVGLALVVKTHLEEQVSDKAAKHVGQWFIHASDIDGDLSKAWKMWDAVHTGIQAADGKIVSAETKETFKKADEWLSQKRSARHGDGEANGTA